jgi:transposase InsO family protein
LVLRHQLNILRRTAPPRPRFRVIDRLIFVWLYRLRSSILDAVAIVQPETVLRWHREGFRLYWRWKSRSRSGRPPISRELRRLIREMSLANPLWGAPRLHGELLKLGIEVAQSTVAKYMARGRPPPGQSWKTFLRNHAAGIAAMDLLVVPTIGFRLLYVFVVLHHHRRRILSVAVTFHPTAEWIARQVAEAFPWQEAPRYLIRDRDAAYGLVVRRRLAAMGIRDRPIAARSPWQNAFVERLIGSIPANASTVSSSSASVTSAIFSNHTPVTTTACELIFPWTRTRRSIAQLTAPDRLWRSQFSAASITIMYGRDFREAQARPIWCGRIRPLVAPADDRPREYRRAPVRAAAEYAFVVSS